jgi:hypothetical protein
MNNDSVNFSKDKVVIAIIDSGVSSNLNVKSNIKYSCNLSTSNSIEDGHGHGTALIGMLDEFCYSKVEFIVIKILDDQCRCTSKTLLEALDIAMELAPDIINLSLGTEDISLRSEFEARWRIAFLKDILLVTTTDENNMSLPFMVSGTTGVKTNRFLLNDRGLYVDDNSVFHTIGSPHIVPWLKGKYVFINKNSFATPYFIREFVNYKLNNHFIDNYNALFEFKKQCRLITELEIKNSSPVIPNDFELYNRLLAIVRSIIPDFDEEKNTFSQGLSMEGCLDILFSLEKKSNVKILFTHFNIYDFEYVSNLSDKIQKNVQWSISDKEDQ